jgi:hypothetical protein
VVTDDGLVWIRLQEFNAGLWVGAVANEVAEGPDCVDSAARLRIIECGLERFEVRVHVGDDYRPHMFNIANASDGHRGRTSGVREIARIIATCRSLKSASSA